MSLVSPLAYWNLFVIIPPIGVTSDSWGELGRNFCSSKRLLQYMKESLIIILFKIINEITISETLFWVAILFIIAFLKREFSVRRNLRCLTSSCVFKHRKFKAFEISFNFSSGYNRENEAVKHVFGISSNRAEGIYGLCMSNVLTYMASKWPENAFK